MQFQVPQFIDIEDKVFGPLTIKQFVYLAGGAGLSFMSYKFLPLFLSILAIPFFVALALALAFYRDKISNQPFIELLEAFFTYIFKSKLYIWKQKTIISQKTESEKITSLPEENPIYIPKIQGRKLEELSWSLTTKAKK